MRQAQDSEIIRLSMKIREGVDFNLSEFEKEVKILPYSNVNLGMLDWAD